MSAETLKHLNDAMREVFRHEAKKNIGCIVYIFDNDEDGQGTGFHTSNCDIGDAMVAIERIREMFEI